MRGKHVIQYWFSSIVHTLRPIPDNAFGDCWIISFFEDQRRWHQPWIRQSYLMRHRCVLLRTTTIASGSVELFFVSIFASFHFIRVQLDAIYYCRHGNQDVLYTLKHFGHLRSVCVGEPHIFRVHRLSSTKHVNMYDCTAVAVWLWMVLWCAWAIAPAQQRAVRHWWRWKTRKIATTTVRRARSLQIFKNARTTTVDWCVSCFSVSANARISNAQIVVFLLFRVGFLCCVGWFARCWYT